MAHVEGTDEKKTEVKRHEKEANGEGNKDRVKQKVGLGELVISWWNGGGRLVSRIEVNPELRAHLAMKQIYLSMESLWCIKGHKRCTFRDTKS